MKRPSFQFYPSDWLRDTALRSCSIGARGLWMDMICFMHEGSPYGHLKVGNKVILASNLCGMVGSTLSDVEGWLSELNQAGVYDTADDGSMFSRRMIKDENLRNMRAAGGKLGGNPALKDKDKVNLKDKQNPTPSSASSSLSSTSLIKEPKGSSSAKLPDCPHDALIDLYAKRLPELPQPRKSLWQASKNAVAMRARWRWVMTACYESGERAGNRMATNTDEGLAWFDRYFSYVSTSDWLTGRKKEWSADLGWLVNASNFEKVMQGNYENDKAAA